MNPQRYVVDANILSALLKREPLTVQRVTVALRRGAELVMCPVVFYEVLRGLLYRDARKQLEFFRTYSATLIWEDLDRADWEYAASLWSDLRTRGHPIGDADLLIGAYAARRKAIVVTDNTDHFAPLGVTAENWRR